MSYAGFIGFSAPLIGLQPFWKLRFAYFLINSKHDIDQKSR